MVPLWPQMPCLATPRLQLQPAVNRTIMYCLSNGLCMGEGGLLSRESCTDSTWTSPARAPYCRGVYPTGGFPLSNCPFSTSGVDMFQCGFADFGNCSNAFEVSAGQIVLGPSQVAGLDGFGPVTIAADGVLSLATASSPTLSGSDIPASSRTHTASDVAANSQTSPASAPNCTSRTSIGALAGGIVGGFMGGVIVVGLCVALVLKRRKDQERSRSSPKAEIHSAPFK